MRVFLQNENCQKAKQKVKQMDFFRLILLCILTTVGANFATLKRDFFNQNHELRRSRPTRSIQIWEAGTENLTNLAEQAEFYRRLLNEFYKENKIGEQNKKWIHKRFQKYFEV